jgi:hypothetical protein
MDRRTALMMGTTGLLLGTQPAAGAAPADAQLVLGVVRLHPGYVHRIELALPNKLIFKTSAQPGRDFLQVALLPNGDNVKTRTLVKPAGTAGWMAHRYDLTPDLWIYWLGDMYGIEIHVGENAKPGTTDLEIAYHVFGPGRFSGGYQIVVEKPDPARDRRIVPVVAVGPGEVKTMLLSTSCSLITRGRGLVLIGMRGGKRIPSEVDRPDTPVRDEGKVFKHRGVTVEFITDAKQLPPAANSVNYFLVRVTAAKDAEPGLLDLHVQDETCSGTCHTDMRVLVTST